MLGLLGVSTSSGALVEGFLREDNSTKILKDTITNNITRNKHHYQHKYKPYNNNIMNKYPEINIIRLTKSNF